MKHIWRVRGLFFDWELTVRVRPAERPPMPITEADQSAALARMKRIGLHFHDAVSLHEYSLEFGNLGRSDLLGPALAGGALPGTAWITNPAGRDRADPP